MQHELVLIMEIVGKVGMMIKMTVMMVFTKPHLIVKTLQINQMETGLVQGFVKVGLITVFLGPDVSGGGGLYICTIYSERCGFIIF